MRFLGLGLADPVPDANTIWTFREALTRATLSGRPAIEVRSGAYEAALTKAGFLAMGGQIETIAELPARIELRLECWQNRWRDGSSSGRAVFRAASELRSTASSRLRVAVLMRRASLARAPSHRQRRRCETARPCGANSSARRPRPGRYRWLA